MQAIIFVGIQGAGKSTYYKQNYFDTHVRINLDMLRTRHREQILLNACVAAKQSFVVDNTNATIATRQRYIQAAKPAGFKLIAIYFETPFDVCVKRNNLRNSKAQIPLKGLYGTYSQLESPSLEEGFEEIFHIAT